MRHARIFALLTSLFVAVAARGAWAWDSGAISPRRPVPDDPLAGLPSAADDRPGPGNTAKRPSLCKLDGTPANARAIGDLRAALAFVQRGPKSWSCPPRGAGSVGLRIAIDGAGKITEVAAAVGDPAIATAMAKKLTGKSIAPRAAGATTGTVMLTFAAEKVR
jgi:hypothetical protein